MPRNSHKKTSFDLTQLIVHQYVIIYNLIQA